MPIVDLDTSPNVVLAPVTVLELQLLCTLDHLGELDGLAREMGGLAGKSCRLGVVLFDLPRDFTPASRSVMCSGVEVVN